MAILETRVISGRGLLRLDTGSNDYKKAKVFTLYADVIRRPQNEYLNITYNEPQSRYAVIRLYRGGYCIQTIKLETLHEAFDFYLDPAAQTMYAVQCAYAGILQSFINLGTALGLPLISVTNNIEDWQALDLMWDEAKVVCYADTGIRLSVRTVAFDLCPEQDDKAKDPPPPPPEDQPEIPPGTPLNDDSIPVSPPYEGDDDNGDTVPYPDDSPIEPEFPVGEYCAKYYVTVQVFANSGSEFNDGFQVFGPITDISLSGDGNTYYIYCNGTWLYSYSPCPGTPTAVQGSGSSSGLIASTLQYNIVPA